jgi:DNA-binding transcriptional ArsR family regulator
MTALALDHVFGALADPTRRAILASLRDAEAPVHVLAADFAMSRPAVSKHLAVLRHAGLVHETKRGRENIYALDRAALEDARAWLGAFWRGRLSALKQLAEGEDE